jgi:hypothetical protein
MADRMGTRFKFLGAFFGSPPGANQIDHLAANRVLGIDGPSVESRKDSTKPGQRHLR